MDFFLHIMKNISLIVILSAGLLVLWMPVIYFLLRVCFFICGKNHVLTAWLEKHSFRWQNHFYKRFKYNSTLYENKSQEYNSHRSSRSSSHWAGISPVTSSFSSDSYSRTNPASGQSMVGSSPIDSSGNVYGTRRF